MTSSPSRLQTAEAWWPLIARILTFLTGLAVLLWQTIAEPAAQTLLVGAALALLGLPVLPVVRALLAPPSEDSDERGS